MRGHKTEKRDLFFLNKILTFFVVRYSLFSKHQTFGQKKDPILKDQGHVKFLKKITLF